MTAGIRQPKPIMVESVQKRRLRATLRPRTSSAQVPGYRSRRLNPSKLHRRRRRGLLGAALVAVLVYVLVAVILVAREAIAELLEELRR